MEMEEDVSALRIIFSVDKQSKVIYERQVKKDDKMHLCYIYIYIYIYI